MKPDARAFLGLKALEKNRSSSEISGNAWLKSSSQGIEVSAEGSGQEEEEEGSSEGGATVTRERSRGLDSTPCSLSAPSLQFSLAKIEGIRLALAKPSSELQNRATFGALTLQYMIASVSLGTPLAWIRLSILSKSGRPLRAFLAACSSSSFCIRSSIARVLSLILPTLPRGRDTHSFSILFPNAVTVESKCLSSVPSRPPSVLVSTSKFCSVCPSSTKYSDWVLFGSYSKNFPIEMISLSSRTRLK
mmetsp:Transcript_11245/g.21390  ORF Transcript_11245/g.21390 Transcript_11245/m.21390 type:complete len:247 (-) Transcript_11245:1349-2089(-)